MGVMSGLAKDFIINKNLYKFQGNLLTLGEQTIFLLPNQVHEINGSDATKFKIELKDKGVNKKTLNKSNRTEQKNLVFLKNLRT